MADMLSIFESFLEPGETDLVKMQIPKAFVEMKSKILRNVVKAESKTTLKH